MDSVKENPLLEKVEPKKPNPLLEKVEPKKKNIKISKIAKKSLKVAIPSLEKMESKDEIPIPEIVAPEIPTIDGKKKKIMAESTLQALAKGREKLQATWAEKRRTKEELKEQALQKKINLQLKQKKIINEEYGLPNDESEEESDSEEEQIILPVKKTIKTKESKAKPEPKLKKKVIRYVEESDSEEEQIVYVKKNKTTRIMEQNIPRITFW